MTMVLSGEQLAERAQEFHGELCPGLAMGVQAARLAIEQLGKEGLVAVAESDICAVDAIQALTGCTLGNRNLIQLDHGKNVYTFWRRSDGRAIRISGKPAWAADYQALRARVAASLASEEEKAGLPERTAAEARRILGASPGDLYDVAPVREPIPALSTVDPWVQCSACGEPVMETRVRRYHGRDHCVPCFLRARSQAS